MPKSKITSLSSVFFVKEEKVNEDTRFLNVTIDVLHTGKNFNNSFFDKEVVDDCIDSIKNTAILGFIKYNKDIGESDFKGHEYILSKNENGVIQKYIGSAYGVIPESCNPRWITKLCDDGEEREFLQVDALLWTKFNESIDIMTRDTTKGQSMELELGSWEGYEDDDGVFHFTKFRFNGCCILGDDSEPAMINSTVEVQFTMSDFVKNIQSELNDKYETFTKIVNKENNQGGIDMPKVDFAQTVLSQFEDISTIVNQHGMYRDRWGDERPRYCAKDVQENEVIAFDYQENKLISFQFTLEGDKPCVDFNSGKRKKIQYADYEEGEQVAENDLLYNSEEINKAFEKLDEAETKVKEYETKLAEANEKVEATEKAKADVEAEFEKVKAELDDIKPKYEEYVKAEQDRLAEEMNQKKDAEFAKYEVVLSDSEDFKALKEKKDEMSVEEIESKCSILYARKNLAQNFTKVDGNLASGIVDTNDDDNDGYVVTKYGNIPVER